MSEEEHEQEQEQPAVPPQMDYEQLKQQIYKQVKQDIAEEMQSDREKKKQQREEEKKAHEEYVEKMKESDQPWVEVIGISEDDKGVKVELEWNDAFVDYLRENGISGTDEEQVIQRWVTLLLRDMADQMEEKQDSTYE